MNKFFLPALVGFLLLASGCGALRPPLRLRALEGRLEVDVQTLGEYTTNLGLIEVAEEGGRKVWQVLPSGEVFSIHSFELRRGLNSAEILADGSTRVVVPNDNPSFELKPGLTYEVRVCAGPGRRRCTARMFRFV